MGDQLLVKMPIFVFFINTRYF